MASVAYPQLTWDDRRFHIEYDSAVALRYHSRRKEFLDRVARLDPALSVIFGSTAFATIVSGHLHIAAWSAGLSAAFSAIDLAFGLADRARQHEGLCRRWGDLRAKLVRLTDNDEQALQELEIIRTKIDADSPDQLRALSYICENEEKRVRRAGRLYEVRWLQRSLADWFTFPWWKAKLDGTATSGQLYS